ncbi:MAG: TonB family protein [Candidatus Fermentibacteraceae bacterium]
MVSPGMKKRAEQLVARAGELARAGNRDKALLALQRAAELDPENEQIQKSIAELEREQAAMRNFSKSRTARAHTNIGQATPADFVSECMKRSDDALTEGDEVRALQELERAKRHDPENIDVNRKIQILRRQIKVNGLFDKAVARLASGEPAEAVVAARRIFGIWSMAPSLPELLSRIEAWTPAGAAKPETAPARKTRQAPAAAAVSPETAAVASIRERIAKSAYKEAYQEALDASSKYPGNTTIRDLITGLEKLLGKTAPVVTEPEPVEAPVPAVKKAKRAEPAPEPVAETRREEPREPEGKKKFPIWIVAVAVLAVLAVVVFVFKPFGPPKPVEPVAAQPYTVSFTVPGATEPHVSIDGVEIHPDPETGVYSFTDTLSTPRTVEIRALGYETLFQTFQPEPGSVSEMELAPDTLGTHTVTVAFSPVMPTGEPDPGPGQIVWMVDGAQVSSPLEIPTGLHVFQPVMEGFNSIPESILVDFSTDVQNFSMALLSRQESQIVLTLAADVPGTANFDIDGERVGSGVRRVSQVLPLGTHTIRVTMENREPWAETVNLTEAGYTRTVAPVEIILTGRLLIGPEPWANVTVNGESRGQTPLPPLELAEGTYTVRLTNPEYEDQVSTVTIAAGEDTSIRYTAQPVEVTPDEITSPVDEPVIPPFPISQTTPVTPSLAQQRGDVHGFVTLEVRVGTDGRVKDVSVINDQVGLGCGQAAIDAVRQWVFNPATQGGSPVEVTTTVQVRFDVE